ncbi:flagellar basal body rod protein FlgB [Pontibacillus litoralis]|uniref:Flagellar basal body rod protein FlgB n=1 Tax=Pontibacillus litoralis JSM 072002 TaxID=1385512 RepID=A0A0A5G8T2_9BACI|nr:flagellar basal body rod protein FlgB [Pontibacillus litoralis]KGX88454.1 flagellar basal body rod protein FlgB [Pontibacillus litoralis JSM 072002]
MQLFGSVFQSLENGVNYSTKKNQIISNNVANVDTPNYKSKNVHFKDVMANEMDVSFRAKRSHSKHIPFQSSGSKPFVVSTNTSTSYTHNGNNVDMDKEMSELANNQIYYRAVVDRLNSKFKGLESVLRGGR